MNNKSSAPVPRFPSGYFAIFSLFILALNGCQSVEGNVGRVNTFSAPYVEADWIRNGEPIEFEQELWYPVDGIESFQDSEMQLLGKARGVEFFADRVDVRPYDRLYTKFARNKFRFYEKKSGE